MWTLQAEILDDESIPPVPMTVAPGCYPPGAEAHFPVHLDPRQGWSRFAVVEFRAGKLAASTSDAPDRVRNHYTLGLFHDDQRLVGPVGQKWRQYGHADDGNAAPLQGLPARTQWIQVRQSVILFNTPHFITMCFHISLEIRFLRLPLGLPAALKDFSDLFADTILSYSKHHIIMIVEMTLLITNRNHRF
jgi:hypothetical protein